MTSYIDDIRNILKIKDPNITFEPGFSNHDPIKIKNVNHSVISATLSYTPTACAKCEAPNIDYTVHKNGSKVCHVRYACAASNPLIIKLKKTRFKCKACNQTFIAETSLVEKNCQISTLQKLKVKDELGQTLSFTAVARHCYVSVHTVMRLMDSLQSAMKQSFTSLPIAISIDELKTTKSCVAGMSFIYSNAVTHEPIDLLPSRQQGDVMAYFRRFPPEVRQNVQWVVMDMNIPYVNVIQTLFPNAEIVVDRFHIVQLLNRALNSVRIEVMNSMKKLKRNRDYTKLKQMWKLVLKSREDLEFTTFKSHRLFDGLMTESMMMEYLLSLDPSLRRAYDKIHALCEAIRTHNIEEFRYELEESRKYQYRRKIRTALNTLVKWQGGIENAMTVTLSNGHLEAYNHVIKNIKRTGHGYRNFNRLRLHVLYILQRRDRSEKKTRRIYFEEEAALIKAA